MQNPDSVMGGYLFVGQVGKCGMGTVWRAWDRKLARYIAIRFLIANTEGDVARFQREAQLAAGLRHGSGHDGAPRTGAGVSGGDEGTVRPCDIRTEPHG